jgi:hypothetical protein
MRAASQAKIRENSRCIAQAFKPRSHHAVLLQY